MEPEEISYAIDQLASKLQALSARVLNVESQRQCNICKKLLPIAEYPKFLSSNRRAKACTVCKGKRSKYRQKRRALLQSKLAMITELEGAVERPSSPAPSEAPSSPPLSSITKLEDDTDSEYEFGG